MKQQDALHDQSTLGVAFKTEINKLPDPNCIRKDLATSRNMVKAKNLSKAAEICLFVRDKHCLKRH